MTAPNPTLMPPKRIPSLKEIRGYGLGERNPKTLPEARKDSETKEQAAQANVRWDRLRKLAESGRMIGNKYI